MSTKHQKWINKYFPKSPIAYQPGLSIVFGSVNVGILLSQLLYWHELGSDKTGWVYKTIEEMRAETGLSRYQQETAIKICLNAGVIDYKLKGIPAKRHFKVLVQELENQLPGLKKSANVHFLNPPTQFARNQQTITKSTQDTTTQNTKTRFRNYKTAPSALGQLLETRYGSVARKSNDFDIPGGE